MRIEINLAQHKYQKRSTIVFCYVLTSLLILGLCWFNYRTAYSFNKELSAAAGRNNRLKEEIKKREKILLERGISDKDIEGLAKRVNYVNFLIEKQAFSWTQFLYYLEEQVPEGISISEINPSFTEGNIQIIGLSKTVDDIVKFVNALQRASHFKNVFLLEHSNIEIEKNKLIRFTITFNYGNESSN